MTHSGSSSGTTLAQDDRMINDYGHDSGLRIPAILKKTVKVIYRKQTKWCNMVGVYHRLNHFAFIVVICTVFSACIYPFTYCYGRKSWYN
jgi:hypothetical protein